MLDRRQRTLGNYYLEWLVLILFVIYILTSWFYVIKKEVKAQPIIIDKNVTYSENDTSNNTLISVKDKLPGDPGYTPETLGQPCDPKQNNTVVPNLPGAHKQQGCDKSTGLVCVQGLVQGGGICLRNINAECSAKNECTPLATGGCIYGFCQETGEVINKPCSNTSECTNNGQFNHVCDPVSRRCKYNIFPYDSGCNNDSQCEYYTDTPNAVTQSTCLDNKPVVEYNATINQEVNFVISDDTNTLLRIGLYVGIYGENNGFLGRFLITNGTTNATNTILKLKDTRSGNPLSSRILGETNVIIDLGGEEGGICVIKYPVGTKPIPVSPDNPSILFPCESQLKNLNGFCVEGTRTNILGSEGQVCNTSGLCCQPGLTCTYNDELIQQLGSNLNVTGTSNSQKIGNIFIKDIGYCTNQTAVYGEFCNNSNKGCISGENGNICLNQLDINSENFQYCGRNWDTFEGSALLKCPTNYTFDTTNEICQSDNNNICILIKVYKLYKLY